MEQCVTDQEDTVLLAPECKGAGSVPWHFQHAESTSQVAVMTNTWNRIRRISQPSVKPYSLTESLKLKVTMGERVHFKWASLKCQKEILFDETHPRIYLHVF